MELIGYRFGKLKVLSIYKKNKYGQVIWECRCDCGNLAYVTTSNLNNGSTTSCGCLRAQKVPKEDLTGRKFNNLTVIKLHNERSTDGRFLWECKCDCGSDEIIIASSSDLKGNRKRSCSCLYKKKRKLPKNLEGEIFGNLKVIKMCREKQQKSNRQFMWMCLCNCGKITYVSTGNLTSGNVKSCGCLKYNQNSIYKDPFYRKLINIWQGIKKRCNNSNYEGYKYYGGRGISVCDDWQHLQDFIKWAVNSGYKKGMQIDRIDVDGNYEPTNCRWVTPKENYRNKTNNRILVINGEKKTIAEWAEIAGVTIKTIDDRLKRGWEESELLLPARSRKNIRKYTGKTLTIKGKTMTISEWSDIIGISYASLLSRINSGWTEEELLLPKGTKRNNLKKYLIKAKEGNY